MDRFRHIHTYMCGCTCAKSLQLCPTLYYPMSHRQRSYQAPLSMGFYRQEYWSGLPFPLPRDLSDLGIELMSLTSPELAGWICICVCICETITAIKIVSTSIPC